MPLTPYNCLTHNTWQKHSMCVTWCLTLAQMESNTLRGWFQTSHLNLLKGETLPLSTLRMGVLSLQRSLQNRNSEDCIDCNCLNTSIWSVFPALAYTHQNQGNKSVTASEKQELTLMHPLQHSRQAKRSHVNPFLSGVTFFCLERVAFPTLPSFFFQKYKWQLVSQTICIPALHSSCCLPLMEASSDTKKESWSTSTEWKPFAWVIPLSQHKILTAFSWRLNFTPKGWLWRWSFTLKNNYIHIESQNH